MAYRKIEDEKLTAVAESIRGRLNTDNDMSVDEMPGLIGDIGIGFIPDYWRSYLTTKAAEINAVLEAADGNKSAFLWYTDAHWTTNYRQSPMILRYLAKHTGLTKTYFGGDIAVEASGETDLLTAWLDDVSTIPNHRSMIGNHDNNYNTDFPTAAERAEFFLHTNRTPDMVFGTDATNGKMYYYVDDHIEQTRYIILSTGRMWTYADEVQWCINTLNSTPSGWHIIVASHLWVNNNYDVTPVVPLETPETYTQVFLDLFDAYNYRESGTTSFASTAYDFTDGKAKVEFVIGGHIHQDYDFATAKGIPVILTECDAWQERDDVSVATKGTITENCIYAIIADYAAKVIKVINVGRGDTRRVDISDVVMYTNWAKQAIDTDGSIYNGGMGYKENIRINSSNVETTATGWDTTGYIPVRIGDVVRFKNLRFMEIPKVDAYPRAAFIFYDANFARLTSSDTYYPGNLPAAAWLAEYTDDGDVAQVTIPTAYNDSIRYMRITMDDINEDSIITVNEIIEEEEPDTPDTPVEPDEPEVPEVSYTNVLPLAIDADGNIYNINDTPGYKANTRLSSSSGYAERTQAGIYTTGFIPVKVGDKIRLKNMQVIKTTDYGDYAGCIYYSTNNAESIAVNKISPSNAGHVNEVQFDENGYVTSFVVGDGDLSGEGTGEYLNGYMRISAQYIGPDSIITINEEIA